jgi:adenylate kinase
VEAPPETIHDRRETVDYRTYREQGQRSIALHQDLNRAAATTHATATDAPICLAEDTGPVDEVAGTLVEIVSAGDPPQ